MQGVLMFDGDQHVTKRRKALRACRRCKDSKKKCSLADDSSRCERCTADGWQCSFERTPAPEHGYVSPLSTATHKARYPSNDSAEHHEHRLPASVSTEVVPSISSSPDGKNSRFNLHPPPLPTTPATCASDDAKDLRYATMLNLMESRDVNGARACPNQGVKLISGTNPLSALLGKELKHTIITNSCSFRTPDPVAAINLSLQRGISIRNCDWEQYYRLRGVPKARLQFLRAIGCFQLPPAVRCTELLEIFFTYIHPMLPVIDRKDFLLCYYGADKPPPLIVLHAVFLAASRYVAGNGQSADGMPETRSHCDEMHAKLRVLIDIDISQERLAVIQAALIASLHWEGREGLNSAIDSLSLAVRACQEMGLHRKLEAVQPVALKAEKQDLLHRRIWWSAYILDRLCAAQEGTPFLINEQDCDVPLLTEADLVGEDSVTVRATMISLSMARLIEDAVRSLYAPGKDHIMLFSLQGVHTRQRLITQLKDLKGHVRNTLLSGQGVEDALKGAPYAVSILCGAILLVHLDAVQILVHRPFLLYPEPHETGIYLSRDACRHHAVEIISHLKLLRRFELLRFSWPFTVYAVVNCLLIFWYDVSSPSPMARTTLQEARRDYAAVVNLLRTMGDTWWAAAAKYKLALALARAAGMVHPEERQNESQAAVLQRGVPGISMSSVGTDLRASTGYEKPPTPLSTASEPYVDLDGEFDIDLDIFSNYQGADYWSSLGLDFNLDVAGNIFSIERLGSGL